MNGHVRTRDGLIGLTRDPLYMPTLVGKVRDTKAGAIVTFAGVSRETSVDARNRERAVETLYYEAYPEMAMRRMIALRDRVIEEFGVLHVACWHRTGEVPVGEESVMIAISSAHRPEAFDACRFLIDELKRSVPIWKRERFADGEEWVEGYVGDSHGRASPRGLGADPGPVDPGRVDSSGGAAAD